MPCLYLFIDLYHTGWKASNLLKLFFPYGISVDRWKFQLTIWIKKYIYPKMWCVILWNVSNHLLVPIEKDMISMFLNNLHYTSTIFSSESSKQNSKITLHSNHILFVLFNYVIKVNVGKHILHVYLKCMKIYSYISSTERPVNNATNFVLISIVFNLQCIITRILSIYQTRRAVFQLIACYDYITRKDIFKKGINLESLNRCKNIEQV